MWRAFDILTGKAPVSPAHLETGRRGEMVAADYLKSIGYRVEDRNVTLGHDEIDVVALDPEDDVLVFAEVKTRTHAHPDYRPELAAGRHKRQRLQRSARRWVAEHGFDGGYRIDLVCVDGGRVVSHLRELEWK